jgi:hypothetical protein
MNDVVIISRAFYLKLVCTSVQYTGTYIHFLIQLFTLAARAKIVFILTKDTNWATKLVKLNGGMEIVPLRGNITNDWDIWEPFDQEPVWKRMDWEVSCLQDLVRPKCKELGLEAEKEITKSMLPKSAQQLVRHRATGIDRQRRCFGKS